MHDPQAGARLQSMTREQKLDRIWDKTHADFKGFAGEVNPDAWSSEHLGRRTILVYEPGVGTVLKLLDRLTEEQIDAKLQ